jgi:hypothetical protein
MYCKRYGGEDAQLIEDDIFRTIIKPPDPNSVQGAFLHSVNNAKLRMENMRVWLYSSEHANHDY